MRNLTTLLFCVFSLAARAQDTTHFDPHNWKAPYDLATPSGWGVERFPIPISFAPNIPYKGVEDIRFSPGWAKVNSDDYWSYVFLWYLDDAPKMDAATIAENLKMYYTGLIKANSASKIAPEKLIPVKVSITGIKLGSGDPRSFTGTIEMTDYMQQKAITLNCMVLMKICPEGNKTILFYELSPKPFKHEVWKGMDQLSRDFKCKKADEGK